MIATLPARLSAIEEIRSGELEPVIINLLVVFLSVAMSLLIYENFRSISRHVKKITGDI
jgi:hypothetical protein